MYRISIFTNTALGLLFIFLGIVGALSGATVNSASVFILLLILFGYGIFLIFNFVCHRILVFNKQQLPLPDWIKNYRKIIFVLSILALLCVLFMTIAAAYAFFVDTNSFSERQRPFYIAFLLLLVLSAVTYIYNVVGYFKSVKENKQILSEYINEIGTSL
jgi:predicted membrane protein